MTVQNYTRSSSKLAATRYVLVIDSQVDNYEQLVAGIHPEFDIFLLNSCCDGIEQITQILQSLKPTVQNHLSLHIVSHGSPGTLYLGNSELSLHTLNLYTEHIQSWFTSQNSELLLYGCNVAAGDAGGEFLTKLHALTSVGIAASSHLVGHTSLGGNWNLDSIKGQVSDSFAFDTETQLTYQGAFGLIEDILSGDLLNPVTDLLTDIFIFDDANEGLDDIGQGLAQALDSAGIDYQVFTEYAEFLAALGGSNPLTGLGIIDSPLEGYDLMDLATLAESGRELVFSSISPINGFENGIPIENVPTETLNTLFPIFDWGVPAVKETFSGILIPVNFIEPLIPVETNVAPFFMSSNSVAVNEGAVLAVDVNALDLNGDAVSYLITGGADSALFSIDSSNGKLSFVNAPDFEAPTDANQDNVYQVQVIISDGKGATAFQDINITVANVNELPVITSNNAAIVREGLSSVLTVTATDGDGDTPTFSISGGDDAALFSINATTGELSFTNTPDFENALDVGNNNVYEVEVTANDGKNGSASQLISVALQKPNQTADFNSDGLADVVWRKAELFKTNIWFTDGSKKLGGGPAGNTIRNRDWTTVGVGDFDHDGERDDIAWRNVKNGKNTIWLMEGINKVNGINLDPITNTSWKLQGVGDFDHSTYTDDLLWRNQKTGQTLVWTMDGTTKTGNIDFGKLNTAWHAQGVGDFEGNNVIDDIVWRNFKTGQTIVWETNGQQKTDSFALESVSTNWKIDGVGDLDSDGAVDDLLFYNRSNNNVVSWFIDNGAKAGNSTVGSPANGWDAVL